MQHLSTFGTDDGQRYVKTGVLEMDHQFHCPKFCIVDMVERPVGSLKIPRCGMVLGPLLLPGIEKARQHVAQKHFHRLESFKTKITLARHHWVTSLIGDTP